jgi:LysR family transcriptional regulator, nitrogen assimilation regulatory protein
MFFSYTWETRLDLKQLTYFLGVCEARSFSRAAARLRLTQPALSRRMRDLETELGVELLERHGRGISLTEAGVLLRERAQGLLRLADGIRSEVAARASEPAGDLVVGLPAAFRAMLTSSLVAGFHADYPLVQLRVRELTSPARQESVLSGAADLAVVTSFEPEEGVDSRPLANESLFLVGKAEGAPVSSAGTIALKQLKGLPLVLNGRPNGMRATLDRALARAGVEANTQVEVDALAVILDLVVTGPYFTVLPYSSIERDVLAGRLAAVPLQGLSLTWHVVSAKGRATSLAARLFERKLRERCRELVSTVRWKTGKLLAGGQ